MAVFSALTHHDHFSQFATIKHMVLHTFYLLMPALMKVSIIPFLQGMVMGTEVCVDVIHHLALILDIIEQLFILHEPVLDVGLRNLLTE